MAHKYYPDPVQKAVFSPGGPQPQTLYTSGEVKVIVAGVEAGTKIPVHPEGVSTFHFLEGKGIMTIDGERMPVGPGTLIVADHGAPRGMEAETRLVFVAVRITELTP